MSDTLPPSPLLADETRGIARSASILALGNVTSRALGFVRDSVIAWLFGAGAAVDALSLALVIPNQLNDLLTGGLVNSALVPVFSAYAAGERRAELRRLASTLLTLVAIAVSLVVVALVVFAPQVAALFAWLGHGNNPEAMALAAPLLRLTLPAVIFLSLSAILSGLLYALKRFAYPAFTVAAFNASLVIVSLALAARWGVRATALGLLVGAVVQVAIQLPGLRDTRLRPWLALDHPGLRRVARLYLPIVASLIVSQVQVYVGLGLAYGFVGGLSAMRFATTLYQFPIGLVGVAVSSAVLPTLSRQAAERSPAFKTTLVQGLNLVNVLSLPAAIGLFVLAQPIVALAFQHGSFTAADTLLTARVLRLLLLGLAFAAVDQMLIFAYYAGQNTLVPALVGVVSVAVYFAVAFVGLPSLQLYSLMLADSAKQMAHALLMGVLVSRRLGGFRGTGLWGTLGRVALATLLMAGLTWAALAGVEQLALPGLAQRLLAVAVPGAVGLVAYFWIADRLGVGEVRLALGALRQRLRL